MERFQEVLHRLKEYRKDKGLTQKAVAEMCRLDQSLYSRMEAGALKMPFEVYDRIVNHCFEELDQIVCNTPPAGENGKMYGLFHACEPSQWNRLGEGVLLILEESAFQKDHATASRVMRQEATEEQEAFQILERLRKAQGISQENMAVMCGVNVQTYRRYEKREVMPDLQMLQILCDGLDTRPSVILSNTTCQPHIFQEIWNRYGETINPESKGHLEAYFESLLQILKS